MRNSSVPLPGLPSHGHFRMTVTNSSFHGFSVVVPEQTRNVPIIQGHHQLLWSLFGRFALFMITATVSLKMGASLPSFFVVLVVVWLGSLIVIIPGCPCFLGVHGVLARSIAFKEGCLSDTTWNLSAG